MRIQDAISAARETIQNGLRQMNGKDYAAVAGVLGVIGFFMLAPRMSESMKTFMEQHGMIMSFFKFAILATLGESIGLRISKGVYYTPSFATLPRMLMWGLIGMVIYIAFVVFSTGTPQVLVQLGLPATPDGFFDRLCIAFGISTAMNLLFAPLFMTVHTILDMHINETGGTLSGFFSPVDVASLLGKVNWNMLWGFAFKKTIPLFWIPAHTVTFLLPPGLRVLFAAVLGVVLGIILAIATQKPAEQSASGEV